MVRCFLVLEDGTVIKGTGFGHEETAFGEVVFNTGMTGYQESLTDPSYMGQILTMSYPLIGNYGVNEEDFQSGRAHVQGFAVRQKCDHPSNIYGGRTIDSFLCDQGIPGISGIDTRELIIGIREHGTMRGAICFDDVDETLARVRDMPYPSTRNLVGEASIEAVVHHHLDGAPRVALIDCGVKQGILDQLSQRFDLWQVPFDTPASWFRSNAIKGIVVSNGPGDPEHPELKGTTIATIQALKEEMPMMGVCMGNQLISIAFGASCYKMKFGHRGANQPVHHRDRVYITTQNHGYAVDPDSVEDDDFVADQFNLNDGTVEGMRHRELPIFSAQHHPEAKAGPWDTSFMWDDFRHMMEGCR